MLVCRSSTGAADVEKSLSSEDQQIYQRLIQKARCDDAFDGIEPGPDCMSGSQLPSHRDINKSCLTNQCIVVGQSCFG